MLRQLTPQQMHIQRKPENAYLITECMFGLCLPLLQ